MEIILILSPLLGPLAVMYFARRMGWRSVWLQLFMSGMIGAGCCAFLARAATAMATAVNPRDAMMRGALVGFVIGLAIGGLIVGINRFRSRKSQKTD